MNSINNKGYIQQTCLCPLTLYQHWTHPKFPTCLKSSSSCPMKNISSSRNLCSLMSDSPPVNTAIDPPCYLAVATPNKWDPHNKLGGILQSLILHRGLSQQQIQALVRWSSNQSYIKTNRFHIKKTTKLSSVIYIKSMFSDSPSGEAYLSDVVSIELPSDAVRALPVKRPCLLFLQWRGLPI